MSRKEEIRTRRMLESGGKDAILVQLNQILALFEDIECQQCHNLLPKIFFAHVRGHLRCFRCHWDNICDHLEENRRRIDKIEEYLKIS